MADSTKGTLKVRLCEYSIKITQTDYIAYAQFLWDSLNTKYMKMYIPKLLNAEKRNDIHIQQYLNGAHDVPMSHMQ